MLVKHLPILIENTNKHRGFFQTLFRQFVLSDFLAAYGSAIIKGGYFFDSNLNENLHIYFKDCT